MKMPPPHEGVKSVLPSCFLLYPVCRCRSLGIGYGPLLLTRSEIAISRRRSLLSHYRYVLIPISRRSCWSRKPPTYPVVRRLRYGESQTRTTCLQPCMNDLSIAPSHVPSSFFPRPARFYLTVPIPCADRLWGSILSADAVGLSAMSRVQAARGVTSQGSHAQATPKASSFTSAMNRARIGIQGSDGRCSVRRRGGR